MGHRSSCSLLMGGLCCLLACVAGSSAHAQGTAPAPRRAPQLLVVLIGGMDSDPTAAQIGGTAKRSEGNSGLYQLQQDLQEPNVRCEYFNWNGTRAGQIRDPHPPHTEPIASVIRASLREQPRDRVAIVGNSWGGHTALETVCRLHDCAAPLQLDLVVFLDPSSTGRGKRPRGLPANVGSAVNFHTRNAFVWGSIKDDLSDRILNLDLGNPDTGYLSKGGPAYDSPFNFPAHVAAEWDPRIHANIRNRLLDLAPKSIAPDASQPTPSTARTP